MTTLRGTLLLVAAVIIPLNASGGEAVLYFNVANAEYAQSDNPPCAMSVRFTDMLAEPTIIAAISAASPKAAAVTYAAGQLMTFVQSNFGGEVSASITEMNGGSRATCESQLVLLPEGATLKQINLSDRVGRENWHYLPTDGEDFVEAGSPFSNHYFRAVKHGGVLNTGSTGDWSGWTGVVIFDQAGRRIVTATAKNWSHDQITHQVMRVVWDP
jgi:hypothetical protein